MVSGRSPVEEIGGGHGSYVRAHAWAAQTAGYEVHIYCVSNKTTESVARPYGTVHHVSARGVPPRQRYIRKFAEPLASCISARKDIWKRAAAVHSFGVWAYAGCLAIERIKREHPLRHVMNMYTVYHVEVLEQLKAVKGLQWGLRARYLFEWMNVCVSASKCERYAHRHCDTLAVNYHCVKDLVEHHLGPHKNLQVVPYGPESDYSNGSTDASSIQERRSVKPVVMTITLQRPKKGVHVFLEALAILKKEGVGFSARIAGGGELRESNMKHRDALGLRDDVAFPGFVEHVEPWLASADIYVQPSLREESGSLALLEAMRQGLPVICSNIDGMAEDIRNGIDGLAVPPRDPQALALAVKELILDPDLRKKFALASQNRFDERHGKAIFSRSLKTLYEPDTNTST